MSPEFFPELALIFGSLVAAGLGIHRLVKHQILRGLGMLAACIGCMTLAIFLGKSHSYYPHTWQSWNDSFGRYASLALVPESAPDSSKDPPPDRTFLVLGGVLIKMVRSDRYTLSMDKEPFLYLDTVDSGLVLSCEVLPESTVYVPIVGNKFTRSLPAGVHLTRPDPHTILLEQKGSKVLRIHYVSQRRVEVDGIFRCEKCNSPVLLTAGQGIRWEGGAVLSGATVDLSTQGEGGIDFERSGRISVTRISEHRVPRW